MPVRRPLVPLLVVGLTAVGCGGSDSPVTYDDPRDDPPVVLFVRGAPGSGGFLGEGLDAHLSDIDDDEAPQGFATLKAQLEAEGYSVRQVVEPDGEQGIDLTGGALDGVDIVVLGSNNAAYAPGDAEALADWVRAGGGLLAFSDANYGSSHGDAPGSDSALLAPFGLATTQDSGGDPTTTTSDRFLVPDHPVLEGVDGYRWQGPSAITLTGEPGVGSAQILVPVIDQVVQVDDGEPGSTRPADPTADAELVVVSYGAGRVVAFYDRDTFFNPGGQVQLADEANARLVTNTFAWLADR